MFFFSNKQELYCIDAHLCLCCLFYLLCLSGGCRVGSRSERSEHWDCSCLRRETTRQHSRQDRVSHWEQTPHREKRQTKAFCVSWKSDFLEVLRFVTLQWHVSPWTAKASHAAALQTFNIQSGAAQSNLLPCQGSPWYNHFFCKIVQNNYNNT